MRVTACGGAAALGFLLAGTPVWSATDWIRASTDTGGPSWGIRGGLVWGFLRASGPPADRAGSFVYGTRRFPRAAAT